MIIGPTSKPLAGGFPERLSRAQFEPLIPHSGRMCVIDTVECWDATSIECLATSHKDPNNPLRINGAFSPVHLLEYGAQAMAIHGRLINCPTTRGMLAALRNVKLHIETCENLSARIRIRAFAEANSADVAVYRFEVLDLDGPVLVEARASVAHL